MKLGPQPAVEHPFFFYLHFLKGIFENVTLEDAEIRRLHVFVADVANVGQSQENLDASSDFCICDSLTSALFFFSFLDRKI